MGQQTLSQDMSEVIESALFLDEEFLDHVAVEESCMFLWKERFSPELFLDDEDLARDIWDFTSAYIQKYSVAPDAAVLSDEFPEFQFKDPAYPVDYILKRFRERYSKNEIKVVLKKVARSLDEPERAREIGFNEFHRISHITSSRSNSLTTADWDTFIEDYKRDIVEGRYQGISFGWPEITQDLGGLRRGGLYYVVGRPKRYKSWMLLNSAVAAQHEGKKVMFYSLELPKEEMYGRYLCLIANVSWFRYSHGCLEPEDYSRLSAARDEIRDLPILQIDRPEAGNRSVLDLYSRSREIDAEVVYIDQMSFIESHRGPTNAPLWERIKYQCEDLKNGAVSADVPVYIANQFNRLADNPSLAEMGTLDMIAGGDAVGQYADMVLGLYANKDMKKSNMLEFGTVESRSFEHARWQFYVSLTREADFRIVEKIVD